MRRYIHKSCQFLTYYYLRKIFFHNTTIAMSSTQVTMTCDDSIYRSKAERIRFLMNILSLPVHIWVLFSDKSFWWYKKVIASNGEDLREATVPNTA